MKAAAVLSRLAAHAIEKPVRAIGCVEYVVGWIHCRLGNSRPFFWAAEQLWPEATKEEIKRMRRVRRIWDLENTAEILDELKMVNIPGSVIRTEQGSYAVTLVHSDDLATGLRNIVAQLREEEPTA